VEDWETPILKLNDPIAERKLAEKYKGLHLIDSETLYIILNNLEFNKDHKNHGWVVVVVPPEYSGDGADDHLIESYMIDDVLAGMIGYCSQGGHVKVINELHLD
jgi:hypothetical protein